MSGFADHCCLAQIDTNVRDRRQEHGALRTRHGPIAAHRDAAAALPGVSARNVTEAIADLGHAVGRLEAPKRIFSRCIAMLVGVANLSCPLLARRAWSGIHYGLRWQP